MSAEDRVIVAQIAGAFGVRGEVKIRPFTEDPEACLGYGPLRGPQGTVLLTPRDWRPQGDVWVVKATETRTREDWEALKGTDLWVPRTALPPPDDEDEVYVRDLIGCEVVWPDGQVLGRVTKVQDFGAGDVVEVSLAGQTRRVWLPLTRACFPRLDISARRVVADPHPDYLAVGAKPPEPPTEAPSGPASGSDS
jgi:16S rRNA processing protein RimM